ncbi:aldo/keto reductase, partial [Haematococcus lacustris]
MEAIGNERNKTMSQEALGALDWLLSDGEVAELDAAAARTPKAMVCMGPQSSSHVESP